MSLCNSLIFVKVWKTLFTIEICSILKVPHVVNDLTLFGRQRQAIILPELPEKSVSLAVE